MPPRRRRKKGELEAVAALMRSVRPVRAHVDSVRVFGFWERALPARIRRNARPVRLERGTLWVHVTTPAWAQELTFYAEKLLERIRAFAPEARVRQIRFKVGPLPEVPSGPRLETERRGAPPLELAELPDDVARALASVRDDDLRAAVQQAARSSLAQALTRKEES